MQMPLDLSENDLQLTEIGNEQGTLKPVYRVGRTLDSDTHLALKCFGYTQRVVNLVGGETVDAWVKIYA